MRRRAWGLGVLGVALALVLAAVFALRPRAPAADSIGRLAAYQDRALIRQAWSLPTARLYGPVGYVFQKNPSVCGPTSAMNLMRSLGRPVSFEGMLAGVGAHPILGVLPGGLTLDQEAGLLRLRTGRPVGVLRGLSLPAFPAEMARSNDPNLRLVVNFTRQPLFGRGHGHFSPVLGYLPDRDLVFVGDVNGGYRPWLAPVARLYAAQDTVDPATHEKRGVLEVALR